MTALTLRGFGLSARLPWRLIAVNAFLMVCVLTLAGLGLFRGAYPITSQDIWTTITGDSDPILSMIVLEYRLPRLATALGVGLALGLAGEMIQTLLRNPLASPDIIGFSAGASGGAVLSIVLLGSTAMVAPGALVGGLLAASLVLALSWRRGVSPGQLILTGIGIILTLGVMTDLMMTRLDTTSAADAVKWLVGSLAAPTWQEAGLLWVGLALLVPLALLHQFTLSRTALEEDLAVSLGMRVTRWRVMTLLLAVSLVALAVATTGPLPFVAFVAGPIAHGLNGAPRPSLVTAALVGAFVVLCADAASQSLPAALALPAGVFTALVGAPVLLTVLLMSAKRDRL
ncbi:iron chelate uptake ABC transporter family permease subunit [uncultured Roseobacter sp.]|uniref:FecCD family ABC transporter permease n=1 Tax=uncultured Roseobacter sp. TaxID=114847 RepID=UPI00260ED55F|nr:iron chelate uptake ABC transporter family permease subunit [uncultured Roseobacter sp.]